MRAKKKIEAHDIDANQEKFEDHIGDVSQNMDEDQFKVASHLRNEAHK